MPRTHGRPAPQRWLGLPPRVALGFASALACLAVAAGASFAALAARTDASVLVRHTAEAQLALEQIESALLVSDAALEAYVAEDDRRHRDQFQRAIAKVRPAVSDLQRISDQHPEEKPLVARLVADVEVARSEQARLLALADGGDLRAARTLAARGLAREAIARSTAALAQIRADEARAHAGREAAWSRSVVASKAVLLVAIAVLLVLILLAARLVADEILAREHALLVQQRLMAVVSHDLRNPLSGILAAGGVLARRDGSPEVAALVGRIVGAGRRMERLIRDLLDWSRMHAGAAIPICAREADLHDVCQRMADELRASDRGRIRVEREGDTRGVFDPDRMEQVVGNLLSNALRYGPPEAPVRIRAVGSQRELRLEVEDGGPGIPPELRAEIFEAFRQGPGGDGSGAGLGLFIVRALVEAHGGAIDVGSTPSGTTFTVRLPRAAPPEGAGETGALESRRAGGA